MRDFAPHIFRKRMICEGLYETEISKEFLEGYLNKLSSVLEMTTTYGPVVGQEAQKVDPKHTGFEGFLGWAESGVHAYTWESEKFFSVDMYSCKEFCEKKVKRFTKNYFKASIIDYKVI